MNHGLFVVEELPPQVKGNNLPFSVQSTIVGHIIQTRCTNQFPQSQRDQSLHGTCSNPLLISLHPATLSSCVMPGTIYVVYDWNVMRLLLKLGVVFV